MIRLRYHECIGRFCLQVGDRARIYNMVELSRMGVEITAIREALIDPSQYVTVESKLNTDNGNGASALEVEASHER